MLHFIFIKMWDPVYLNLCMKRSLQIQGFQVERQKPVPIEYAGPRLDEGFRVDLLVNGKLLVELKSIQMLVPVHGK